MGQAVLREVSSPSWSSASPQSFMELPLHLVALQEAGADLSKMDSFWWSLLLEPGVLVPLGGDEKGIVFRVTQYGALVWPVTAEKLGDRFVFHFKPPHLGNEHSAWRFVAATDMESMRAARTKAFSPVGLVRAFPEVWKNTRAANIVAIVKERGGVALMPLAAARGFRDITVPFLKKIWAAAHARTAMPGARPSTELALVRALVQWSFPQASAEEVEQYVANRGKAAPADAQAKSVMEKEENLLVAEHMFEKSDHKDAAALAKRSRAQVAGKTSPASVGASGGAPSANSSTSAGASQSLAGLRPVPNPDHHSMTPAFAKAFLPKVAGASITLDDRRHLRWVGGYRHKPVPPFSHSVTYGDESRITSRQSLMCGKHTTR